MKYRKQSSIAELTPVMTVGEAAKFLRVNRSTILFLIHNKGMPAFKVGSDWRIHRGALDKWTATLPGPGETKSCAAKRNQAKKKP